MVSERLARVVRPEILASWRRSKAFGAQSHVRLAAVPRGHRRHGTPLRRRRARAANLAESLAGLHAGVLLADREANIVQRWVADSAILPSLDRISSDAGFSAAEHRVGTNGIGTIAELGRAQMVVGLEHYADALVGVCVRRRADPQPDRPDAWRASSRCRAGPMRPMTCSDRSW